MGKNDPYSKLSTISPQYDDASFFLEISVGLQDTQ